MMEYMAFAKPIVAFDLPEHRVTAKQAAMYVTPNDEHAFALALAQLMDDPVRRKIMGAFGRHRIETELAWRFSVSNLLDVYRKVLPGSGVADLPVISEPNELRPQPLSSKQVAV
jgi:glycosyltransferase involved in cell wall biosynthesis